jgi:hypothetical protein
MAVDMQQTHHNEGNLPMILLTAVHSKGAAMSQTTAVVPLDGSVYMLNTYQ